MATTAITTTTTTTTTTTVSSNGREFEFWKGIPMNLDMGEAHIEEIGLLSILFRHCGEMWICRALLGCNRNSGGGSGGRSTFKAW